MSDLIFTEQSSGATPSAGKRTVYYKPDGKLYTKNSAGVESAFADSSMGAFSHRNKVYNGSFAVNQTGYVSGAAVDVELYGHDGWKMATAGDTYTFATVNNKTTVTIPAGKVLRQIVEGLNLQSGTYVLSWEGTAQGKIGAGVAGASGITGAITGGVNTTLEWGPGTIANVQLETGTVPTPYGDRPYGTELALCQRHYVRAGTSYNYAAMINSTLHRTFLAFPVAMRSAPTVTTIGYSGGGTAVVESISIHGFTFGANSPTSDPYITGYIASARL